ncbi:MAG: UDP-N-acetylmuramoyl-L-alanine--D-glutamate ligase [Nitrospirota bacterium]
MIQVKKKEHIITTFKNKRILVVGLARSGTGAANLLASIGAHVTVTDKKPMSTLQQSIKRLVPSVKVVEYSEAGEVFDGTDIIVISPGIPLDIPLLVKAADMNIPIIGELELTYQAVAGCELRKSSTKGEFRNTHPAAPHFIGVTGTNGKSTVVTLIDLMMKESRYRVLTGGNIGNALSEEVLKTVGRGQGPGGRKDSTSLLSLDFIVAEISSFQLETINKFRPKIAAILNLSPDHLDRYESMNDYTAAKARIFENQTDQDCLVINADDPAAMELYNEKCGDSGGTPEIFFFSRNKKVKGVYARGGVLYCNLHHLADFPFVSVEEIKISGVHNLENAMAAALVSMISGCSCEAVRSVLQKFAGLEHRLEVFEEMNGVKFINDSKGTNVGAVAKSLEGLDNVLLIMGGIDKGSDFTLLREPVREKVKLLILLGEAKEKIAHALEGAAEIQMVEDLTGATELSMKRAAGGDVVLLSPGCASFDMFKDFEDRGKKFKEAVKGLLKR